MSTMWICIKPKLGYEQLKKMVVEMRKNERRKLKELKRMIYEMYEHVDRIINGCGYTSDCINATARTIIDIAKKVHELLGVPYEIVEIKREYPPPSPKKYYSILDVLDLEPEYELTTPLPPWFS